MLIRKAPNTQPPTRKPNPQGIIQIKPSRPNGILLDLMISWYRAVFGLIAFVFTSISYASEPAVNKELAASGADLYIGVV